MTAEPLLLADATLPDGSRADVAIAGGRVLAAEDAAAVAGARRIELGGALLTPAFVDGHIHLDKSFHGTGWRPHVAADSLTGRIAAEADALREVDAEIGVSERAVLLARRAASYGTTALRTHVDVHPEQGLDRLEAVLAARATLHGELDVQVVAFPQRGVLAAPGTAALLERAARAGADVIGGLDPAGFDGDVEGQLDVVFGTAERHGLRVDVHLHDPGTLGTFQLRRIAHHATRRGMQGRVAVSHAYALGQVAPDELARTAAELAGAGVAVMTNGPGAGGMPPVLALRAAGVHVFAGTDNIRDAWWPYGSGDMLERASMIGYRQELFTDADLAVAFELVTTAAAAALGLEPGGLRPGARASLVALDAACPAEAVASAAQTRRLLVLRDGRAIAGPLAA